MRDLLETAERIAASNVPVMIVGESGTGKEMLARFIHAKSARSLQPFVAVNMSSIPENLVESELFGHTKGSFTGATQNKLGLIQTAHNGSFFMDEIESMPLAAQSKLLRVVQDGKIQPIGALEPMHCQVRWISASNRKMSELIQNGLFREDLFFRLGVVVIDVPPLRERSEDVIALARSYLRIFSLSEKRPELELTAETTEILLKYQWPGNVRELKNVIERACVLAKGDVFAPDTPEHMRLKALNREIRIPLGSSLENAENKLFAETLKLCDGDKAKAAQILGVNLRTIYRWMDKQPTDLQ